MGQAFVGWSQWKPDGYPIQDQHHNPWLPVDPISGNTAYQVWLQHRPISENDFRALLRALKGETEEHVPTMAVRSESSSWDAFPRI